MSPKASIQPSAQAMERVHELAVKLSMKYSQELANQAKEKSA